MENEIEALKAEIKLLQMQLEFEQQRYAELTLRFLKEVKE